MSLHSSLRVDKAGAAARTVFTRVERIKELMKKGQFNADSAVTNLPKTKVVRVKAGKKKVKEEGAAGAAGAAPAGAAAGKAAPAAAAKAPAKK
ncbi:MAG: small basic protein [Candidatus Omnitrophica bacterium]|nr:small basic protein [Candidatus Omnitrophota bacterium]